jgi:hypothetical protein
LPANISGRWSAIHGPNISSEIQMIENLHLLEDYLLPILPPLLQGPSRQIYKAPTRSKSGVATPDPFKLDISSEHVQDLAEQTIAQFRFNEDQIRYERKCCG